MRFERGLLRYTFAARQSAGDLRRTSAYSTAFGRPKTVQGVLEAPERLQKGPKKACLPFVVRVLVI